MRALGDNRQAPIRTLRGQLKGIAGFLANTNITSLVRVGSTKLDVLLVGVLAGPSEASLYKIATQFGASPLLLRDPLYVAIYPTFTRWRALGLGDRIRTTGRKASVALTVTAVPVALVLATWSEQILTFVVGAEFADAWIPMVVVLVGVLPVLIFFWAGPALLATGDAGAVTKVVTFSGLLQIALLFPLTSAFGATGAAVSLAAMGWAGSFGAVRVLHTRGLL